jgi:hypothetical protein
MSLLRIYPQNYEQNLWLTFGFGALPDIGMCMLTGRMVPEESAAQMRGTWDEVME